MSRDRSTQSCRCRRRPCRRTRSPPRVMRSVPARRHHRRDRADRRTGPAQVGCTRQHTTARATPGACASGDHYPMSATEPSYILSSRGAYFFSTTLRLTLRLGVSSPPPFVRSFGRIAKFFTLSYFARLLLTSLKYGSSRSCASLVCTTSV